MPANRPTHEKFGRSDFISAGQIDVTRPSHLLAGTAVAAIALLGMVAAFGTAPQTQVESVAQEDVLETIGTRALVVPSSDSEYFIREERIRRSDSMASLLERLGVAPDETLQELGSLAGAEILFRQMVPGKIVTAQADANGTLQLLTFPINSSPHKVLLIERGNTGLRVVQHAVSLETEIQMKSGRIRFSLYGATDAAGIPDSVANKLADIFGGEIDFHRDLRDGDRFSVVYESINHAGRTVRTGRVLAAEFVNDGKVHSAVWFDGAQGSGYYTPDGKSLQKTFLRSPLEFSRVTSGLSSARFHPVLQQWRAHRGVDYGAAVGTRVRATADGVVEFAGTQGGYGKVVILRHQGRYSTVYGHLSKFGPGIRPGTRVSQGDIIALTGATGLASGPHLHYEFRVNGNFQNPLTVALPSAPSLIAGQLDQFRTQAETQLARIALLRASGDLASLD